MHQNKSKNLLKSRKVRGGIALALATISAIALAEEGGTGHYQPGSISSFADGVSSVPALIVRLNVLNYSAESDFNVPIPIAGSSVLGAEVDANAVGLTVAWAPEWGLINDTWNFQMSATIPYVWVDISGDVQVTGPGGGVINIARKDSQSAIGDIVLFPLMFNQKINPDFNVNYRLGFYAPTGSYEVGQLANTGKNYWTAEPTVGFMYFGQKNGREASVFLGADFNQENSDTHYKTGTQVHIDSTFAQHFPMGKGLAGIGLTAYWYQQVTGDSGSGATFGDFEGKTNGVGPVLSYVGQLGGHKVLGEFRWTHEYNVEKRLSGDILFLKAMLWF